MAIMGFTDIHKMQQQEGTTDLLQTISGNLTNFCFHLTLSCYISIRIYRIKLMCWLQIGTSSINPHAFIAIGVHCSCLPPHRSAMVVKWYIVAINLLKNY